MFLRWLQAEYLLLSLYIYQCVIKLYDVTYRIVAGCVLGRIRFLFGSGGPYEKLAVLPAARVRVSDIQRAVHPFIYKDRATPDKPRYWYNISSLSRTTRVHMGLVVQKALST